MFGACLSYTVAIMIFKDRVKSFIKYCVVGGIAFVTDTGTMGIIRYMFLKDSKFGLYISVAIGFVLGLVVNYCLSSKYVFERQNNNNWKEKLKKFALTFIVGFLGLIFTEVGMYIGTEWLRMHYIVVKIMVAGFVLIWNYMARLLFVFKERE